MGFRRNCGSVSRAGWVLLPWLTFIASAQPAANPPVTEESVAAAEAKDPSRPKVVSVTPANGSEGAALTTDLRIRFDRPMDPLATKLNWRVGGFLDCGQPAYDSNRFEFTFPVRLAPGVTNRIIVNEPLLSLQLLDQSRKDFAYEGFQSADRHQAALFVWQFQTRAPAANPNDPPPKIISISPPSGAVGTLLTFVEIQFDQPMTPPADALPRIGPTTNWWKGAGLIANVQYNPANHTFRLPLLLPPRDRVQFQLAGRKFEVPRKLLPYGRVNFSLEGFYSATGVPAAAIPLEYRVAEVEMSSAEREKIKRGTADKRLLDLLTAMKAKRAKIRSLAERVLIVDWRRNDGEKAFNSIDTKSASFQMQLPGQFYGDISQIMSCGFRIGSDNKDWWFHFENDKKGEVIVCPADQMHIRNLSFCDPFDLASRAPAKAAAEEKLNYVGMTNFAGVDYHLLEAWNAEAFGGMTTYGSAQQWWIDARTLRPVQLVQYANQSISRMLFFHDVVNQPLAPEVFAVPRLNGIPCSPPEALDAGYTNRFVTIRDGANGRMSERWGKQGPKGTSSGGLN